MLPACQTIRTILGRDPAYLSIDIETDRLSRDAEIVSVAIAYVGYEGTVAEEAFFIDRYGEASRADTTRIQQILETTLFDRNFPGTVVFHNLQFDLPRLIRRFRTTARFCARSLCRLYDTLVISRLTRNNKYVAHADSFHRQCHSLKFLAQEHLSERHNSFEDVVSGNIRFTERQRLLQYNLKDAQLTLRLMFELLGDLEAGERECLDTTEMPHALSVFHLNYHGVPFNKDAAESLLTTLSNTLPELEKTLIGLAGRTFNAASQPELSSATFYNPYVTYHSAGKNLCLLPPAKTPDGHTKVDTETLSSCLKETEKEDPHGRAATFLRTLLKYVELSKAQSQLESLLQASEVETAGALLRPNITADALTGRIRCSNPNLLGLPKALLKRAGSEGLPEALTKTTIRGLIEVPAGYSILSIDISGLDLVVITAEALQANPLFPWKEIWIARDGHYPDPHFTICQLFTPDVFRKAFSWTEGRLAEPPLNYWPEKPERGRVGFIHKTTGAHTSLSFPADDGKTERNLKQVRGVSKQLNLATAYLVGPAALAKKLEEATGLTYSISEAASLLDRFYETFPELRARQDYFGNELYRQGFVWCPFGRKHFGNTFDDLNEHAHIASEAHQPEMFEFVCLIKGRYWLVRANGWVKGKEDVIANLRSVETPFSLPFESITSIEELPRYIFRPKPSSTPRRKESKFQRKNEQSTEEITRYELSRIALTAEIDRHLGDSSCPSPSGIQIASSFLEDGLYRIPEKCIHLFRARTKNPSSEFFKLYTPLLRSAKKFFPAYCQGVAATVAKLTLAEIRRRIEVETTDAVILLFIHDSFDVMVRDSEKPVVEAILKESVASPKGRFPLRFTGEFKDKGRHFS